MEIIKSGFLRLNSNDLIRGVITAVLSAVVLVLCQAISDGGFRSVSLEQLLQVGTVAGLGYLIKNFFTTSDGKFGGVI